MTDLLDILAEWREVADRATHNGEFVVLAVEALLPLLTAVENVLKLHGEFRIYDECECVDPGPEGHVEVHEVGRTCNHLYSVCRACCTDDGYQREDCANYHDHTVLDWECPTYAAIRDAIGGSQ